MVIPGGSTTSIIAERAAGQALFAEAVIGTRINTQGGIRESSQEDDASKTGT